MRKISRLLLFVSLAISFSALLNNCSSRPTSHRRETVMGVFNEIIVSGKTKPERELALDRAFEILREIEKKMSHFDAASEVSRINRKGFEQPQEVSPETFEVIRKAVEFFGKTGGAFDVTVLPLMRLWGFYSQEPAIPSHDQIQSTLTRIGPDRLILDSGRHQIGFFVDGAGIDLGGIAKGYACDQVVNFLKDEGIENALVNIGGTIFALGKAPGDKPWRVGLRHPRDPNRTHKVLSLVNEAVSTSGDYEQFFVENARRYSHILDPRTGYPANRSIAASVVASSAMLADILSTTLFILGPEEAASFMRQFPEAQWTLAYFSEGDHIQVISSE